MSRDLFQLAGLMNSGDWAWGDWAWGDWAWGGRSVGGRRQLEEASSNIELLSAWDFFSLTPAQFFTERALWNSSLVCRYFWRQIMSTNKWNCELFCKCTTVMMLLRDQRVTQPLICSPEFVKNLLKLEQSYRSSSSTSKLTKPRW